MKKFFAFCLIILLTALSAFSDVLKPGVVINPNFFKIVDEEYGLLSPVNINRINFLGVQWDKITVALDPDADDANTVFMVQYEKENIQETESRDMLTKLSLYMIDNGFELFSDNEQHGFLWFKKYYSYEGILLSQSNTRIIVILIKDIRG
ncbi:MAG: hypothetical protein FWC36_01195 [Spirochaetes bacterium]|nr:hypothetical protein [Spirochaetota bacterium]